MRPASAFTLLEILIVMALIGVLATLTFTLGEGIRERGKIGQAKVELAVLAAALEAYKSRHGDYPQTGGYDPAGSDVSNALAKNSAEAILFNALFGVFDPTIEPFKRPTEVPGEYAFVFGKSFVEGTKFSFEFREEDLEEGDDPPFPEIPGEPVTNAFLDPWGRRYQYFYKNVSPPSTAWDRPGFVLYSVGLDGLHDPPSASGYPDYNARDNIDNIYAGRN